MKIKAAVLREFNKPVSVEEVNLASPKEKEVLEKSFGEYDVIVVSGRTFDVVAAI